MQLQAFALEHLETPTGTIQLFTDERGRIRALDWRTHEARTERLLARYYRSAPFSLREATRESKAKRAVLRYFDGKLDAIDELEVVYAGTDFQNQVWRALRRIPRGQTWSYGMLARAIGRPATVRAVGLANGANPIAIVVPCHRVIGADASLTGYGGGLERKHWLLTHEGFDTNASRGKIARG
jgi:methylated-DNA-[protein]-cysteine S-methyltransferase